MVRQHAATLLNSHTSGSDPLADAVSQPSVNGSDPPVRARRKRHVSRPLQFPRDRLALTIQRCREASGLSLYRLAERSGVDYGHLWRIEHGEHREVSREILLLISIALVFDSTAVDRVVEVANEILDAAGFKLLRAPWETASARLAVPTDSTNHPESKSH